MAVKCSNRTLWTTGDEDGYPYWVEFEDRPFTKGNTKFMYKGRLNGKGPRSGDYCTLKVFRTIDIAQREDWSLYINRIERANKLAAQFNKLIDNEYKVKFLVPVTALVDISSTCTDCIYFMSNTKRIRSDDCVVVEPYIGHKFRKFYRNSPLKGAESAYMLQAFSHFTASQTGDTLICGLQGVALENEFILTNPIIHSANQEWGPKDQGPQGFRKFFTAHTCNDICRSMDLPEYLETMSVAEEIEKDVEAGTSKKEIEAPIVSEEVSLVKQVDTETIPEAEAQSSKDVKATPAVLQTPPMSRGGHTILAPVSVEMTLSRASSVTGPPEFAEDLPVESVSRPTAESVILDAIPIDDIAPQLSSSQEVLAPPSAEYTPCKAVEEYLELKKTYATFSAGSEIIPMIDDEEACAESDMREALPPPTDDFEPTISPSIDSYMKDKESLEIIPHGSMDLDSESQPSVSVFEDSVPAADLGSMNNLESMTPRESVTREAEVFETIETPGETISQEIPVTTQELESHPSIDSTPKDSVSQEPVPVSEPPIQADLHLDLKEAPHDIESQVCLVSIPPDCMDHHLDTQESLEALSPASEKLRSVSLGEECVEPVVEVSAEEFSETQTTQEASTETYPLDNLEVEVHKSECEDAISSDFKQSLETIPEGSTESDSANSLENENIAPEVSTVVEAEQAGETIAEPVAEAEVSEKTTAEPVAEAKVSEKTTAEPSGEAEVSEKTTAEPVAEAEVSEKTTAEPVAEAKVSEKTTAEPVAKAKVSEKTTAEPVAKAKVSEKTTAEPVAKAKVSEKTTAEPVAKAKVSEKTTAEPVAEAKVSEKTIAEPVAEAKVSEKTTAEPVAEAEVSEKTTAEPVAEAEVSEKTIAEPVAEAKVSEKTTAEPVAEAKVSEKTIAEPVAEAEVSEKTTAEPVAEAEVSEKTTAEPVAEAKVSEKTTAEPVAEAEVSEKTTAEPVAEAKVSEKTTAEPESEAEVSEKTTVEPAGEAEVSEKTTVEPAGEAEVSEKTTVEPAGEAEVSEKTTAEPKSEAEVSEKTTVEPAGEAEVSQETTVEPAGEAEVSEKTTAEPKGEAEVSEKTTVEPAGEAEAESEKTTAEPTGVAEVSEKTTAEPTGEAEVSEETTVETTAEPTREAEVSQEITAEPTAEAEVSQEITAEPTAEAEVPEETTAEPTAEAEVSEETTAEPTAEAEVSEETTAEPTAEAEVSQETIAKPTAEAEVSQETIAEPTGEAEVSQETIAEPTGEAEVSQETIAEPTGEAEVSQETIAEPTGEAEVCQETIAEPTGEAEVCQETTAEPTGEAEVCQETTVETTVEPVEVTVTQETPAEPVGEPAMGTSQEITEPIAQEPATGEANVETTEEAHVHLETTGVSSQDLVVDITNEMPGESCLSHDNLEAHVHLETTGVCSEDLVVDITNEMPGESCLSHDNGDGYVCQDSGSAVEAKGECNVCQDTRLGTIEEGYVCPDSAVETTVECPNVVEATEGGYVSQDSDFGPAGEGYTSQGTGFESNVEATADGYTSQDSGFGSIVDAHPTGYSNQDQSCPVTYSDPSPNTYIPVTSSYPTNAINTITSHVPDPYQYGVPPEYRIRETCDASMCEPGCPQRFTKMTIVPDLDTMEYVETKCLDPVYEEHDNQQGIETLPRRRVSYYLEPQESHEIITFRINISPELPRPEQNSDGCVYQTAGGESGLNSAKYCPNCQPQETSENAAETSGQDTERSSTVYPYHYIDTSDCMETMPQRSCGYSSEVHQGMHSEWSTTHSNWDDGQCSTIPGEKVASKFGSSV